MGFALCFIAFLFTFRMSRRSLGHGLSAVLATGYFYGIIRAHFPDGGSHFVPDAAAAAIYLAQLTAKEDVDSPGDPAIKIWLIVLTIWPVLTILISPFVPSQDILIQLVGLRAAIYFLPFIVLGTKLSSDDLRTMAIWLCVLNIIAFAVGVLEFQFGIEKFIPETEATKLIYMSTDVGEDRDYRIPSIFGSAHAFAGTMLLTAPFLVWYLERISGWRRWLTLASLAMSVISIFMAAARSPVIQLAMVLILATLSTRFSLKRLFAVFVMMCVVGFLVYTVPRFQRFTTLSETEMVQKRISGGQLGFVDVVADHPLGVGLGGAFGTSIPYFLQDRARPMIGIENEYGRIALEQSVFGLALWCTFVGWLLLDRARKRRLPGFSGRFFWLTVVACWGTGFIGVGILTAIPSTPLLLLQMGLLAVGRTDEEPLEEAAAAPPRFGALPRAVAAFPGEAAE